MQINLIYDSNALAAPQSFRDAIQAAANVLDSTFTDNISINISVGYGEINGQSEPSTGASAAPSSGVLDSYSQVRSWLAQYASPDVQSGVAAMPTGTSIQGQSQVAVWRAQERLMGQLPASDTVLDGSAGFGTGIATNLLEGVALHELTHAMGRVPYGGSQPDIFDLYRFSGAGTYLFGNAQPPAAASYFSLDGGKTDLADYGRTSDPSDFLNSSGRTPNDPFNEFYNASTTQALSQIDILQMEALGFHAQPAAPSAVEGVADFNADHRADILWRASNGDVWLWNSNSSGAFTRQDLGVVPGNFTIAGVADFNGDKEADILWRDSNGGVSIWSSNLSGGFTGRDLGVVPHNFTIAGAADFNGDGRADILWRDSNGGVSIWNSNLSGGFAGRDLGIVPGNFTISGVADFNGDGRADILWRDSNGGVSIWNSNLTGGFTGQDLGIVPTNFTIAGAADFNGDGRADILWRDSNGGVSIWNSNLSGGFTGRDFGIVA